MQYYCGCRSLLVSALEKNASALGKLRIPHRERLMADNAVMSMMFKSAAIILC